MQRQWAMHRVLWVHIVMHRVRIPLLLAMVLKHWEINRMQSALALPLQQINLLLLAGVLVLAVLMPLLSVRLQVLLKHGIHKEMHNLHMLLNWINGPHLAIVLSLWVLIH